MLVRRFSEMPLSEEGGFSLVEVLVSAVLVVIVSLGVYAGIDGASVASGINKHRSIATELAQQDQDRMRAMAVNELSNYRDSYTQPVGGITYTIASASSWVTDSSGAASCTSGTAQANYLQVSSKVTWPGMTTDPITVESIVSPPNGSFGTNQGSLAVQVFDRNGVGVPGVVVTLTGPQGYTDVTNSAGCVLWGYLPVSTATSMYTVTIGKAGYVDRKANNPAPSQTVSVIGESTNTISFDYDLGGRIQGNYQTVNTSGTVVAANGLNFSASNPNLTVPIGPFGDGAQHTTFTTAPLYPFTTGYSVYAGDCPGAAPGTPQTANVTPGGVTSVNLMEPPINFKVVNGSSNVANQNVKFTATGTGCNSVSTRTTDATGFIVNRLFLYGTYTYCTQTGTSPSIKRVTGTVTNSAAGGTSTITADLNTATTGTCP